MKDELTSNPNEGEQLQDKKKKPVKRKRDLEISEEAKETRRLLAAFLLDQTEELKKERNRRKRKAEQAAIELRGGNVITLQGIKKYVTAFKRRYKAILPNTDPFFSHVFRLHPKLYGLDPRKYTKPYLAGKLLKKLLYDRFTVEFGADVLPALIVFAMPDGVRLYKCHEFLTDSGVVEIERFRDEANGMMKNYKDLNWYEFDKDFSSKCKLPFQPRLL